MRESRGTAGPRDRGTAGRLTERDDGEDHTAPGDRQDGVETTRSPEGWGIRRGRESGELIASIIDAAWFFPGFWARSVLGDLRAAMPAQHSEYGLLWSSNVGRTASYLADVLVSTVPGKAPSWLPRPFSSLLFHRSHELAPERPDPAVTFAGEEWFFINGILTNEAVARMNAECLVDLFHRPIRVLWNSTDGITVDLLECATEKLGATSEDVNSAFHPLLDALADTGNRRVVLICHSQGTLITAVLLRLIKAVYLQTATGAVGQLTAADRETVGRRAASEGLTVNRHRLKPVGPDELAKLEVYCFANCATEMEYIDEDMAIPRIESFGNEHDLVARLGMLAPNPTKRQIKISGPRFRRDGAWGHLLNAHYLIDIDKASRRRSTGDSSSLDASPYALIDGTAPAGTLPRLFSYLNGADAIG